MRIGAALEHPQSPHIGSDVGALAGIGAVDVSIGHDVAAVADAFDVLVDFSHPAGALAKLDICIDQRKGVVIGTTGFDAEGLRAIDAAAEQLPLLMAPNMSVGVNIAFKLIEYAAKAFGDDVDVEVFEAHHRHKVDAPSGTAVRMGEILARALNRDLATDAVYGRQGITGERDRRGIGFHSLRGGDIVGDHTVTFAGAGERIRNHPSSGQPRELRRWRRPSRALHRWQESRALRHERRARPIAGSELPLCLSSRSVLHQQTQRLYRHAAGGHVLMHQAVAESLHGGIDGCRYAV